MRGKVLIILFVFTLSIRLINFSQTLNFSADQAELLTDAAQILSGEKIKLIGIPIRSRVVNDKYFFIGSQTSYFLAIWEKLFNYDPQSITVVFAVINSLAVILTVLLAGKIWGEKIGISVGIIFATNPFAVDYSKVIWNPTLQPILAALGLWLLLGQRRLRGYRVILLGLVSGTMISIHYAAFLLLPLVVLALWRLSKRQKFSFSQYLFLYGLGVVIGLGNLIFFEARHNLYNSRLLVAYYLGGAKGATRFGFEIHDLLMIMPLIFLSLGYIFQAKVFRKRIGVITTILLTLQIGLLIKELYFLPGGFGMTKGVYYPDLVKISKLIASDQPKNFNVAQIIDGNTRADATRYLLTYQDNLGSQLRKYDEYRKSDVLYVVKYPDQNILNGGPYELSSFSTKRQLMKIWPVNSDIVLAKYARSN